ncbi:hypothetical protein [Actinoplanes couchii]|uniref:Uncharacterized protein n=1 Tax=Actinoplanes couchii TaxID=403638 RepID=A0ABQ3XF20_9ACTN|nr:hypothetical protein [Actinoplanes couchii]MDR6321942.1 hypothetical protein [Actinoplanes couchii]GID57101.1 hypothetical protein Aco03nite_055050 [Actinoplanes couchii]
MTRFLVVLAVVAGTLVVTGGPVAAHAGGLTATDARGRVVAVSPSVPGLTVETIEAGARLRLRNDTGSPITINPGGGTAAPAVVAPGTEVTWIDTRATPDGRTVPASRTVPWTLTLDAAGTPVTVTGELVGEKRPRPAVWWIAAALTGAALLLAARRLTRAHPAAHRHPSDSAVHPHPHPSDSVGEPPAHRLLRADLLLAVAGSVAALASAAHVIGSTLAVESAPMVTTFLSAAGINLLAWPLVIGGAVTVLRGRAAGVLAVCAGAALTAVFVLPDVTSFHRPVLPFAGPATLERVLVVLALGLGAGVAIAGAGVLRSLAERVSDTDGSLAEKASDTDGSSAGKASDTEGSLAESASPAEGPSGEQAADAEGPPRDV